VVTVAALSHPECFWENGLPRLPEPLVLVTKEKIRTILRITAVNNHDSVVLSAFGCGAFANPPGHMAQLFQEVLEESEFNRRFKCAVFAILEDRNSRRDHNPEGNVLPFAEVFS
jgi:uncharacterized protein (TIGR02452 family)